MCNRAINGKIRTKHAGPSNTALARWELLTPNFVNSRYAINDWRYQIDAAMSGACDLIVCTLDYMHFS